MKKFFLFFAIVIAVTCNAQQYDMASVQFQSFGECDFITREHIGHGKFFIKSQTPGLNTDDIQFKRYADIITNLFDLIRGTRVYSESEADHIIYVNLSISGPYEVRETYNSPSFAVPQGNVVWQFGGPRTYSYNVYKRNMSLTVYDKEGENIWKVNAYSEGQSNDLSYVLRIMCYVIDSSVGKEDSKNVVLTGNDLVKAGKFPEYRYRY